MRRICCEQTIYIDWAARKRKIDFCNKTWQPLRIPVHHLDRHMFERGGKKRDKEEFLEILKAMLVEKSWIIEGCSMSTLDMRFAQADTVIYFQLPRLLCIWRIFKRWLFFDKTLCDTGCLQVVNWKILRYIWDFEKDKGEKIKDLRMKYPQVDFQVFKSLKDADKGGA